MIPDLFLNDKGPIDLALMPDAGYHDTRLPSSHIYLNETDLGTVTIQESVNPLYVIGYRVFRFFKKIKLAISERNRGLCFKAVLSGEFHSTDAKGKKFKVRTGEYYITDSSQFLSQFNKDMTYSFFLIHYSKELLEDLGYAEKILPSSPSFMNNEMKDLIQDMLHNPYDEKLREFFYENSIRELLFLHLASPKGGLPGDLSDSDIAKIYKADSIILENINAHFSIRTLSKMAGTNEFKLKKGFKQLFGMGVFARLLERRMGQACQLLETTEKPIWEVAEMAGYDTLAGFIKAFRKKFGQTPRQWRVNNLR